MLHSQAFHITCRDRQSQYVALPMCSPSPKSTLSRCTSDPITCQYVAHRLVRWRNSHTHDERFITHVKKRKITCQQSRLKTARKLLSTRWGLTQSSSRSTVPSRIVPWTPLWHTWPNGLANSVA